LPNSIVHEEVTTEAQDTPALPTATNNQNIQACQSRSSPSPHTDPSRHTFLKALVRLWVPKTTQDLNRIKQNPHISYLDHPYIASRTALCSSLLFIFHTMLLLFIGIGWNFDQTGYTPLCAWLLFLLYRVLKTVKRILNRMYFVLENIRSRKASGAFSTRSSTTPIVHRGSSAAASSISLATMRSLPVDFERRIEPLTRQGTEADMGLVPPSRRQTYPRSQE
jgi:hypothetical protein